MLLIRRKTHSCGSIHQRLAVLFVAGVCLCGTTYTGSAVAGDFGTERGLEAGDVILRFRLTGIQPYNQESNIEIIGGHVNVPSMLLPDIDISVFLSDNWSITGQAGVLNTEIKLSDTIYGDIDVGTVWSLPVSLAMQYHFETGGALKPYFGAGMIANWYFGEKPAGGYVKDFSVSASYAPMIKAGFDYQLNPNWFANFEVKHIFPPTQTIENHGARAQTSLDTISLGLGLGYRF